MSRFWLKTFGQWASLQNRANSAKTPINFATQIGVIRTEISFDYYEGKRVLEINEVRNLMFTFFIKSSDYNGISLREVSEKLSIEYSTSIDIVKELVSNGDVSIQSSTNPHIFGHRHHSKESQLKVLEEAKKTKLK